MHICVFLSHVGYMNKCMYVFRSCECFMHVHVESIYLGHGGCICVDVCMDGWISLSHSCCGCELYTCVCMCVVGSWWLCVCSSLGHVGYMYVCMYMYNVCSYVHVCVFACVWGPWVVYMYLCTCMHVCLWVTVLIEYVCMCVCSACVFGSWRLCVYVCVYCVL